MIKKIIKIVIWLIFIYFFWGCSEKQKIVYVDTDMKIKGSLQSTLIKRYKEYWNCFSKKDLRCSYKIEMPYQRFIHDFEWYRLFNTPNQKNYTIELEHISSDGEKAEIRSKFASKEGNVTFIFFDVWYYVDGVWYHKMKTSRLPLYDKD